MLIDIIIYQSEIIILLSILKVFLICDFAQ